MLRVLRIAGVVVFGLLIGLTAHSLRSMHESGELFDRYNSRRRADIALIGFSSVAVLALGYFELAHIRRLSSRRRYGEYRRHRHRETAENVESSDIYSSSAPVDDWHGLKIRTSNSFQQAPPKTGAGFWVVYLRIISLVLPCLYTVLLVLNLRAPQDDPLLAVLMPSVFGVLLLLALITALGVFRKKTWGITVGYVLSVCNLVIFPYGTATGMFLILGLAGAAQTFVAASAEKHKHHSRHSGGSRAAMI